MLFSKPFCRDPLTCSDCKPVDIAAARRFCLNADIVVVKTIRLCYLDSLKNIIEDSALDTKVRLKSSAAETVGLSFPGLVKLKDTHA